MDVLLVKESVKKLLELKDFVLEEDKKEIMCLLNRYEKIISKEEGVFKALNISKTEKGKFKSFIKSNARRLFYKDLEIVKKTNKRINKFCKIEEIYVDYYYEDDKYNKLSQNFKFFLEERCDRFFNYKCKISEPLENVLNIIYSEVDKVVFSVETINSYVNYTRSSYSNLRNELHNLIKNQIEEEIIEQYPNIKEVINNKTKQYETSK